MSSRASPPDSLPYDPGVVGEQSCLGPVGAAELDEHARHVSLDRRLGQVQPARYLGIRQSLTEAAEHLGLPFGQRADELAGVLAGRLAVGGRGDQAPRISR